MLFAKNECVIKKGLIILDNWEIKFIPFVSLMLFVVVFLTTSFLKGMVERSEDLANYEQNEKIEDIKMFATRNKDYEDQTSKDSIQIILEFDERDSKDANIAVMNYLSNVNGKLLSVNGKNVMENTLTPVVGGMYGSNTGLGLGLGFTTGTDVTNKSVLVVLVPKDDKFADNLQERIDQYLKYKSYNMFKMED